MATDDSAANAQNPSRLIRLRKAVDAQLADPANILVIVVLAAILAVWTYRQAVGTDISIDPGTWGQFGDFLGGVLNPLIAFFTLTALLVTVRQNSSLVKASMEQAALASAERLFAASKEALESAITGFKTAVDQVTKAGNDRVKWISAARLLAHAQRLSESITEQVHLDMLEIAVEQARRSAGDLLGAKAGGFYYGSTLDPKENPTLRTEEAAKASTRDGKLLNIPEEAIWEFWSLAQFPDEYDDPLSKKKINWDLDSATNKVMWPGLFDYLRHRRDWHSVNGNLVSKIKPPNA